MIKSRVISITTDVIDHSYTGLIKEDMTDDIIGSFVVCIVSRKLLLREIKEGFKACGLKDPFLNHSELCRPLFLKGHVKVFGARIH